MQMSKRRGYVSSHASARLRRHHIPGKKPAQPRLRCGGVRPVIKWLSGGCGVVIAVGRTAQQQGDGGNYYCAVIIAINSDDDEVGWGASLPVYCAPRFQPAK